MVKRYSRPGLGILRSQLSNSHSPFPNKKSIWEKLNARPKRSDSRRGFNQYNILAKPLRSQFQIQQMAFMIVAVVIFFVLVGLFFLAYQSQSLRGSFAHLQRDKAISSLSVIANMPEISCGDLCVDADKIEALSEKDYSDFWGIASLKVYKVYPSFGSSVVKCPAPDCNYWEVHNSGQGNISELPSYVSICRKVKYQGSIYDRCEIGKMLVGVKT